MSAATPPLRLSGFRVLGVTFLSVVRRDLCASSVPPAVAQTLNQRMLWVFAIRVITLVTVALFVVVRVRQLFPHERTKV